jgi:hypothetical protein
VAAVNHYVYLLFESADVTDYDDLIAAFSSLNLATSSIPGALWTDKEALFGTWWSAMRRDEDNVIHFYTILELALDPDDLELS